MFLLCSRCGKVAILNVFKTGINAVSFFPVVLSCVLGVFNSPVATPAHGLRGLSPSRRLRFASENASLLALYIYLYHQPQSHFTKLLTRALFFGPCHC